MTYARARLWLGIACVGTLVLLAVFGLWLNLPALAMTSEEKSLTSFVTELVLFCGFLYLVIAPFDLLGGYAFPKEYGRYSPKSLGRFFLAYFRGALLQVSVFTVAALTLTTVFNYTGLIGLALASIILGSLMLGIQPLMSHLGSGIKHNTSKHLNLGRKVAVDVAISNDNSFTGGITGTLLNPKVVIPEHWQSLLSKDELDLMISRREWAIKSKSRSGGVLIALIYMSLGLVLSFFLTESLNGLNPATAAGYTTSMLWNILWGFIGVLTLPSLSRQSSNFVDGLAIQDHKRKHIDSAQVLESALKKIEGLSDDEPNRSKWLERIFHPIPARSMRYSGAQIFPFSVYAWNCLRTYLYSSWIVSGIISRAVHCNVGKPDLWVYLPSD